MKAEGPVSLYRYSFGTAQFDEARFELRVGGAPIEIQRKPLEVLAMLLRHVDEVVTREELLEQVWQGRPTVEHVVANALAKLRFALGEENAARIVTQTRVGYRLTGPIERVAIGRSFTSSLELSAGSVVPGRESFQLDSVLGKSPTSEVWLARHKKTGEPRVYKFSPDGERLAALKREVTLYRVLRESLGERDDIARIIDWNFESAPFFLECEYGGSNLLTWAQGEDLRAMPLSGRLSLFLKIADAVAAAHGVGVLHKDLKPANVLVRGGASGWRICVTDFGSGRLMEPQRLTALGITQLGLTVTHGVGSDSTSATPLYLAPELVAGQAATVRSDVYALGLILYQLVVGDFRSMPVSGWERGVPDELLREDIEKATDGDPLLRLSSVAELTDRLRRIEDRREARKRTRALERSRARRPWVLSLLATLSVGLMISAWSFRAERMARQQAEHETSRVEAVNAFLTDLLHDADPSTPGGNASATIREVLDRATAQIETRFAQDPVTRAMVDLSVGGAWFGLGEYAVAESLQRQAVTLLVRTKGETDMASVEARYALARTLDMSTRHKEASQVLDAADQAAGAQLRANPSLALLAHWTRGGNAVMQMQPERALREFEAAELIRAQSVAGSELWMLRVHSDLAWCYVRLNRAADAVHILEDLMTPGFSADEVGISDWTKIHLQYALALTALGRSDEAIKETRAVIAELDRVLGSDHYLSAVAWNHLSAAYKARGDWQGARSAAEHAYMTMLSTVGKENQATLSVQGDLWIIEYLRGNVLESIPQLQAARDAMARVTGAGSPFVQCIEFYLASALNDAGRTHEARVLVERLDAAALEAGDPGNGWASRIEALRRAVPRDSGAGLQKAGT